MLEKIWDFIVRARTWVLGVLAILIEIGPEILGSSEVLDAVPQTWRHVLVVGLLVWSRWRFATRAADPEVQVKMEISKTDEPSTIIIKEAGQTTAVING